MNAKRTNYVSPKNLQFEEFIKKDGRNFQSDFTIVMNEVNESREKCFFLIIITLSYIQNVSEVKIALTNKLSVDSDFVDTSHKSYTYPTYKLFFHKGRYISTHIGLKLHRKD